MQDDPTDNIIAPEDWEPHGIICRAPLDALYNQQTCCGCPVCERERGNKKGASAPEERLG